MIVNRTENEGGSAMKTLTIAVLATVAAVTACSHTTYVSPPDMRSCARVSEKIAGHKATVTLTNGAQFEAQGVLVALDSVSWLDPQTDELRTVPTAEVWEIHIISHGKGALEGLGIGLLTGALTGAALGASDGDDPPGWFSMTAAQKAKGGAVVLGGLGALVGPTVGAGVGHRDVYRFDAPRPWYDQR
jgi:hypothetical protein